MATATSATPPATHAATSPSRLPACIRQDIVFHEGYLNDRYRERTSTFSLFTTVIPNILLRVNGSVLPHIIVQVLLATAIAAVAVVYFREADALHGWTPEGHSVVGTLLAFLTVFRMSFAWSMYQAGVGGVATLRTFIGSLVNVALAPMLARCATDKNAELPDEAFELCRLLKLFFFLCVSHLRASEGDDAREWCEQVAFAFATESEVAELDCIGSSSSSSGSVRSDENATTLPRLAAATPPEPTRAMNEVSKEAYKVEWLYAHKAAGLAAKTRAGLAGAAAAVDPRDIRLVGPRARPNTSRAKVLRCLLWLNVIMRRVEERSPRAMECGGYMKMAGIGSACRGNTVLEYSPDPPVLSMCVRACCVTCACGCGCVCTTCAWQCSTACTRSSRRSRKWTS